MNQLLLIGRLTKDIETTNTSANTVIAYGNIAVKRDYKNEDGTYPSDFFDFKIFGSLAEKVTEFTSKGDLIWISAKLKNNKYQTSDGSTKYVQDIIVEKITVLQRIQPAENGSTKPEQTVNTSKMPQVEVPADDLPF